MNVGLISYSEIVLSPFSFNSVAFVANSCYSGEISEIASEEVKYSCLRASVAVILLSGLKSSIYEMRFQR